MFNKEDFEIPLEKQLKMRVVFDEIENCSDVKELRTQLKACAETLMTYQHLLGLTLQKQMLAELEKWDTEASKIVKEAIKENNGSTRQKES